MKHFDNRKQANTRRVVLSGCLALALAVPSDGFAAALATTSTGNSPSRMAVGVRGREGMAVIAMHLHGVGRGDAVAATHVLPLGHGLQMLRIAAERVSAQVVEHQALGDRAPSDFVGKDVRVPRSASVRDATVPQGVAAANRALPDPTATRINNGVRLNSHERRGVARNELASAYLHARKIRILADICTGIC